MTDHSPTVFFKVDANATIGTGHWIRCLMTADVLIGCRIIFITSESDARWVEQLADYGYHQKRANTSTDLLALLAATQGKKMLIIDTDDEHYYSEALQEQILNTGCRLMYITIKDHLPYLADLVLNQNIIALDQHFQTKRNTRFLLGPDYFIFKPVFRNLQPLPIRQKPPYRLLITFGGADRYQLTQRTIASVKNHPELFSSLDVVLGGLHTGKNEVREKLQAQPLPFRIHIQTSEMHRIMQKVDLAISAAGLTLWELALLGRPSFVIAGSAREKFIIKQLDQKKYCCQIGSYDDALLDKKLEDGLQLMRQHRLEELVKVSNLTQLINPKGIDKVRDEIMRCVKS